MNSDKLKTTVSNMMEELEKFTGKSTKVGGTRLRKLLSEVAKECKVCRTDVLTQVKSMPKRARGKKVETDE